MKDLLVDRGRRWDRVERPFVDESEVKDDSSERTR